MKTVKMNPRKKDHDKFGWVFLTLGVLLICTMISLRSAGVMTVKRSVVDTTTPPPAKKYSVLLSQTEWDDVLRRIEVAKISLRKSDLPSKDVVYLCDSLLVAVQNEIIRQVGPQIPKDTKEEKPKNSPK